MKSVTFITGNKNKLQEVMMHTTIPIEHIDLDLEEIQSLDPIKIIDHKVREAYKKVKKPVLVEDISLTFHALGKLPGPLIKWFLEEMKTEGLCRLLDSYQDRSATASVTYGYYDGQTIYHFQSSKTGTIAKHPRGDKSFGWNPTFIPDGWTKTYGEMSKDEHKSSSIRTVALEQFEAFLQKHEK